VLSVALAADGPYYVNAADVNLRQEPNGAILLKLELDDKVFVIKRFDNWAYISERAYYDFLAAKPETLEPWVYKDVYEF
jgi:hypothetical protein